jgi:hypothetical protein
VPGVGRSSRLAFNILVVLKNLGDVVQEV